MTRTSLIAGLLGNKKTASTPHLLTHKDPSGKWAVLVNGFGEVGIDGALLANNGTLLKGVPDGYICCVSDPPMQIGLNVLLRWGKPDRLLIEPTGLGRPKQILDLLTTLVYEPWIDPRAMSCILNPCLLLNEKSASNENFRNQLAAVGIIIVNKSSRATSEGEQAPERWWRRNGGDQ